MVIGFAQTVTMSSFRGERIAENVALHDLRVAVAVVVAVPRTLRISTSLGIGIVQTVVIWYLRATPNAESVAHQTREEEER